MTHIRSRLTFANVTSVIALFVALGGGAYAVATKAPRNSVDSKAIVDGSVKSVDVKKNGLTGADIKETTLNGVGGGGGVPSGPAGGDLAGNYPKPQIAPGAVGSNALENGSVGFAKLGTITRVVSPGKSASSNIDEAIVTCPAGTWAIRGGGGVAPATNPVTASVPYTSANGQISGWQIDTGPGTGGGNLVAEADCLG